MSLSEYYPTLLGSALGGAVGYAVRQNPLDMAMGLALGGGAGYFAGMAKAKSDFEASNPNAPTKRPANIPAPPVGRPEVAPEAAQMFAGQPPSPSCYGMYRSYYGVHDWGEDANGVPHPVWDLLGRWSGSLFAPAMVPYLDQLYGQGYSCHFNKGVWAVSPPSSAPGCPIEGTFMQIGKSRADCGMGPIAKG